MGGSVPFATISGTTPNLRTEVVMTLEAACVAASLFWSPQYGCLKSDAVRILGDYAGSAWVATCSADGVSWPARKDGVCYMADKPNRR